MLGPYFLIWSKFGPLRDKKSQQFTASDNKVFP
jgi:hypothetical protein